MNSDKNHHESAARLLHEELKYLRNRPLRAKKTDKLQKFSRPVASFSKPERLKSGMGTEITLIFRSRACSWARSNSGGCTMCGYWNDRAEGDIRPEHYWQQFTKTLEKFQDILDDSTQSIVFKMFTSGSFCDPKELDIDIQLRILQTLAQYPNIKEIVIESRPEYLTDSLLSRYQQVISNQYLEIGIGIESSSDYIRSNVINKGFNWESVVKAVSRVHSHNFGVKAYLLFKPPFLTEYAAVMDLTASIRDCLDLGVDTISINPTNIQQNTICSVLAAHNQFRSPWLYSLLWIIKHTLNPQDLSKTRVICDPSAAGKDRGIHNFYERHPSNQQGMEILQKFVETQDLNQIPEIDLNAIAPEYYHQYRTQILYRRK